MCICNSRSVRIVVSMMMVVAASCAEPTPPQSLDELANRSLAQIDGELEIAGLREPVEVIRDEWGVPHIYA